MTNLGDTNVRVQINGVTFGAIYEVVGSNLELTSADFGERSAKLGNSSALSMAEHLLHAMVEEALCNGVRFVRDNGTLAN